MRAIILAGGKGTRLKPYTTLIPKPLVPIGEEISILEIIIQQLKASGFSHVTLAVNHHANLISAFMGDGSKWGVKIDYSLEKKPLSTIGPLTIIKDLPETFLVMNGDILCDLPYEDFLNTHIQKENQVSVAVHKGETKIDFGVLKYNSSNYLTEFQEKPNFKFDVSMGIYCFNRSALENIPKGKEYGFDNLMLDRIKQNKNVWIYPFNGFWLDIGRPSDYEYAFENYPKIKKILRLD